MRDGVPPSVRRAIAARGSEFLCDMRRRLLLLDLDPAVPSPVPRIAPLVLLPLPGSRAAVPLADETPEEILAMLLAGGLPIRSSRVIDA